MRGQPDNERILSGIRSPPRLSEKEGVPAPPVSGRASVPRGLRVLSPAGPKRSPVLGVWVVSQPRSASGCAWLRVTARLGTNLNSVH